MFASLGFLLLPALSAYAHAEPGETVHIQIRVGPRDGAALMTEHLQFQGHPGDQATIPLQVDKASYVIGIHSVPAGEFSSYSTVWEIALYRSPVSDGNALIKAKQTDPRELGGPACVILTDYANTDGLWLEIGMDGPHQTAEAFCAENSKLGRAELNIGYVGGPRGQGPTPLEDLGGGSGLISLDSSGPDPDGQEGSQHSIDFEHYELRLGSADLSQVSGASQVESTVQQRHPQLGYCYEQVLRSENPNIAGTIVMQWVVASQRITSITAVSNDTGSDLLASCVVKKMKRWRFASGSEGLVTWPLVFGKKSP